MSQQNPVEDGLVSGLLRAEPGLISATGGLLKWNLASDHQEKSESNGTLSPPPPVVWSALIPSTVFTFFVSFVSSAFWKLLKLMAC